MLTRAQSVLEVTLCSRLCISGLGERPHTCGLGPGLHRLVSRERSSKVQMYTQVYYSILLGLHSISVQQKPDC